MLLLGYFTIDHPDPKNVVSFIRSKIDPESNLVLKVTLYCQTLDLMLKRAIIGENNAALGFFGN